MNLGKLLFSFDGRINRAKCWLAAFAAFNIGAAHAACFKVDYGGGCEKIREIPILGDDAKIRVGRNVKVEGTLGRFGSALVKPAVYIAAETVK